MNKFRLVFLVIFLFLNIGFSQTKSEISILLDGISKTHNSKDIEKSNHAKKIMNFGKFYQCYQSFLLIELQQILIQIV